MNEETLDQWALSSLAKGATLMPPAPAINASVGARSGTK